MATYHSQTVDPGLGRLPDPGNSYIRYGCGPEAATEILLKSGLPTNGKEGMWSKLSGETWNNTHEMLDTRKGWQKRA